MKEIFLKIVILIFVIGNGYSQDYRNLEGISSFKIYGELTGVKDGPISVGYFDWDSKKGIFLDSAQIENGAFVLMGEINGATMVVIQYDNVESNAFLIDVGDNKVNGRLVKGEKIDFENLESPSYIDQLKKISFDDEIYKNKGKAIYQTYNLLDSIIKETVNRNKDSIYSQTLLDNYDKCKSELGKYEKYVDSMQFVYLAQNPDSYYTAFNYCFSVNRETPELALQFYNLFSEKVKNGIYGKYILSQIKKNESFLRLKAPEFRTIDINGDSIRLTDFKGKFVLLEFWASWCKPCRVTHPKLRNLYNLYNKDGLEIISLSSDSSKDMDKWKTAIMKDSIDQWKHILLKDRDENKIMILYNVHFLPTKILIDKEGNIVRKYNSSEFDLLEKDLKFIFKY
ncbi:MAG TPA: TlpA disulfide reductase family protein [Saprospiraceae bacterium]|nr:TlpA disulfide reductase family protein [Saprospiraceae bacterium]